DLDEGGLARAILTQKGVHFAGQQAKIDIVQRHMVAEHLDDAPRLKRETVICHCPSPPLMRSGSSTVARSFLRVIPAKAGTSVSNRGSRFRGNDIVDEWAATFRAAARA